MKLDDIKIGGILTAIDGEKFQIQCITVLNDDVFYAKDMEFALDLAPIECLTNPWAKERKEKGSRYDYRWVGCIEDLYKTFSRIDNKEIVEPATHISERLEIVEGKLDRLMKEVQNLKDLVELK